MKGIKITTGVILIKVFLFFSIITAYGYGGISQSGKSESAVVDNSGNFQVPAEAIVEFPGLTGPDEVVLVPREIPTPWEKYSAGSETRLAILLTDPDSNWLSLVQGLKAVGIPFSITTDYKKALQHNVVLVYPAVGGKGFSPAVYNALLAFPEKGGTLIGVNVAGNNMNRMNDLFGFDYPILTRENTSIRFGRDASPLLAQFSDHREMTIMLGDKRSKEANYGTYAYVSPRRTPLAVFDSGKAAIIQERRGRGMTYAFGLDLGGFLAAGYNDRGELFSRCYINEYEPASDVLLRLLREMYTAGEKDAVTIGSVPFDKKLSVIITHDVDFGPSMDNALIYAEYEKSVGIRGTYFIQTKYITDWNDKAFFTPSSMYVIKKLEALGMEVASHGVAHSKVFKEAPLGTGNEKFPQYKPYVAGRYEVHNCTVLGELRISKFLLEKNMNAGTVVSFRPGELSNPPALAQALGVSGYKYSSTLTANTALSHLPFRLSYGKGKAAETEVFEFPVTIEDELLPSLEERLGDAVLLAEKIGCYGGIYVVLIHPNITGEKLEFEKRLVEAVKSQAWFDTMREFGDWWSARDSVQIDVSKDKDLRLVEVTAPLPIEGLTLKIPSGWRLKSADKDIEITQQNETIIIKKAAGKIKLIFSATAQ